MKVGTWVQFEGESNHIGYIQDMVNKKFLIKLNANQAVGFNTKYLQIDLDGYATDYERKNRINRIIEFQA